MQLVTEGPAHGESCGRRTLPRNATPAPGAVASPSRALSRTLASGTGAWRHAPSAEPETACRCCSAFASRQVLYEHFFQGDRARNVMLLTTLYDTAPMAAWVREVLERP